MAFDAPQRGYSGIQVIRSARSGTLTGSRLISVLCVDDNALVGDAVATMLRVEGGFEWLGRLGSADGLAEAARELRPSIILLDLDMPGLDPLSALREVAESVGGCRVIIFSGHVRRELLDRAIDAGAWGYISKSDGEEALVVGIKSVVAGEFALSAEARAVCERG